MLGRVSIPSNEQLLRYFRLRKSWEAGERVAAAEVVLLNAAKRELRDQEHRIAVQTMDRGNDPRRATFDIRAQFPNRKFRAHF